ncbi:hypothetical protein, partial [Jeotgalibaca porci]|uniref:hypothetical protein n=1 Tax=Jeotgalibaca porci TaxID=1868793 RepID=UPI0035A109A6
ILGRSILRRSIVTCALKFILAFECAEIEQNCALKSVLAFECAETEQNCALKSVLAFECAALERQKTDTYHFTIGVGFFI